MSIAFFFFAKNIFYTLNPLTEYFAALDTFYQSNRYYTIIIIFTPTSS